MNDYKVPQDVEAEDKLLGPFNFRQFIYLIVVALSAFGAFGLFQLFPPLVIIPVPFILFFGALALPIRKDQPMEIYLAAVISFYLKPRLRFWQPDGVEHLIEITAPKVAEPIRTKDISRDEAVRRLSYLSDVVDTGGWAIKNSVSQNSSMHDDLYNEAQNTEDIFEDNRVSNNINEMIALNDQRRKQEIISHMNTARSLADFTDSSADDIQTQTYTPKHPSEIAKPMPNANLFSAQAQTPQTETSPQISQNENSTEIHMEFNPYPNSMHQSVISPISANPDSIQSTQNSTQIPQPQPVPEPEPEKSASTKPMSNDIMRLVTEGTELSVETIARQANKIHEKEINAEKQKEGELGDGVFVKLR